MIDFDERLSAPPFGSANDTLRYCREANAALVEFNPSGWPLFEDLARLLDGQHGPDRLFSPPLRYLTRQALRQEAWGPEHIDARGNAWIDQAACTITDPATYLRLPLFRPSGAGAPVVSKLYDREFHPSQFGVSVEFPDPAPAVVASLRAGLALLAELLPRTTESCLTHVCSAYVFRPLKQDNREIIGAGGYIESVSSSLIPGGIFLNEGGLFEPWLAAETILHEATHAKLFDLYLSPGLLIAGYDEAATGKIVTPWNQDLDWRSNAWPFDQALGAYHVYVHLFALFLAARFAHPPNNALRDHIEARLQTASERSAFLESQLLLHADRWLTRSGAEFLRWLSELRGLLSEAVTHGQSFAVIA